MTDIINLNTIKSENCGCYKPKKLPCGCNEHNHQSYPLYPINVGDDCFKVKNLFGELKTDWQRSQARSNLGITDIIDLKLIKFGEGSGDTNIWQMTTTQSGNRKVYDFVVLNGQTGEPGKEGPQGPQGPPGVSSDDYKIKEITLISVEQKEYTLPNGEEYAGTVYIWRVRFNDGSYKDFWVPANVDCGENPETPVVPDTPTVELKGIKFLFKKIHFNEDFEINDPENTRLNLEDSMNLTTSGIQPDELGGGWLTYVPTINYPGYDYIYMAIAETTNGKVSSRWSVVQLTGAAGALGPKGDRGETGLQGLQGEPGSTGGSGEDGVGVKVLYRSTYLPAKDFNNLDIYRKAYQSSLNMGGGAQLDQISGEWSTDVPGISKIGEEFIYIAIAPARGNQIVGNWSVVLLTGIPGVCPDCGLTGPTPGEVEPAINPQYGTDYLMDMELAFIPKELLQEKIIPEIGLILLVQNQTQRNIEIDVPFLRISRNYKAERSDKEYPNLLFSCSISSFKVICPPGTSEFLCNCLYDSASNSSVMTNGGDITTMSMYLRGSLDGVSNIEGLAYSDTTQEDINDGFSVKDTGEHDRIIYNYNCPGQITARYRDDALANASISQLQMSQSMTILSTLDFDINWAVYTAADRKPYIPETNVEHNDVSDDNN